MSTTLQGSLISDAIAALRLAQAKLDEMGKSPHGHRLWDAIDDASAEVDDIISNLTLAAEADAQDFEDSGQGDLLRRSWHPTPLPGV